MFLFCLAVLSDFFSFTDGVHKDDGGVLRGRGFRVAAPHRPGRCLRKGQVMQFKLGLAKNNKSSRGEFLAPVLRGRT